MNVIKLFNNKKCGWEGLGEEEKHALPNYVGMYYIENCEHRKAYDLVYSFTAKNIEITKFENITIATEDSVSIPTIGGTEVGIPGEL